MKKKELLDENNRLKKENDYLRLQMLVIKELLESSCESMACDRDGSVKKIGRAIYYCETPTINDNLKFIIEFEKPYNFFHPDKEIEERG